MKFIANPEKGEYITKDGKLEITLEEYNKRSDNDMFKGGIIWAVITFICLSILAL